MIHKTREIDKKAKISKNVKIGPFCYVGPGVELKENVELISNVHLEGNTSIGHGTKIYPFASIGTQPQDLKFKGEKNSLIIGKNNFEFIKKISIEIFNDAFLYLKERGIILSDTKFEFGFDSKDNIFLIDEVLTPDSSRFWLEKDYKIDCSPKSLEQVGTLLVNYIYAEKHK